MQIARREMSFLPACCAEATATATTSTSAFARSRGPSEDGIFLRRIFSYDDTVSGARWSGARKKKPTDIRPATRKTSLVVSAVRGVLAATVSGQSPHGTRGSWKRVYSSYARAAYEIPNRTRRGTHSHTATTNANWRHKRTYTRHTTRGPNDDDDVTLVRS